jgi:hypothetical protein
MINIHPNISEAVFSKDPAILTALSDAATVYRNYNLSCLVTMDGDDAESSQICLSVHNLNYAYGVMDENGVELSRARLEQRILKGIRKKLGVKFVVSMKDHGTPLQHICIRMKS